jgi:hypothetical protein
MHVYGEYALAKEYSFGCPDGEWNASLDCRIWGKNGNLILYFTDLNTGAKRWLSVFWNDGYKTRDGSFNFRTDGYLGEKFILTTGHSRTGKPVFKSARRENDDPELIALYKRRAEVLLELDMARDRQEAEQRREAR